MLVVEDLIESSSFGTNIVANMTQNIQNAISLAAIFEPPRGKTNIVVSEQVRHKSGCTVKEKS